jgi:protein SCO1
VEDEMRAFAVASLIVLGLALSGRTAEPPDGPRAAYFPKVKLKNQLDQDVNFYEDLIKGKTVLINVFYTECDGKLCSKGTDNLVKLQNALGDRLGKDVFMYSISLRPEHDTPKVLEQYAKDHGAKWQFLTGKPEDVQQVLEKLGLSTPDLKVVGDPKQHSGMVRIGNEAIDKWTSASVLDDPDHIRKLIANVKPPKRASR